MDSFGNCNFRVLKNLSSCQQQSDGYWYRDEGGTSPERSGCYSGQKDGRVCIF